MTDRLNTPNLFILGAPKCGTTSIYNWLNEHPGICMSKVKEPHYFNFDHTHRVVTNYSEYLTLFKRSEENEIVFGESSVWYLYSKKAVPAIIEKYGLSSLKFIVMLRNPVSMAPALHEQQVFNLNEPEKDFETAWRLQFTRDFSKKPMKTTRDVNLLEYGEICKLGQQVERLLDNVPKQQIHFILMDDLKLDPNRVYLNLLEFLEVQKFQDLHLTAANTAKQRQSQFLALIVKELGLLKQKFGIRKGQKNGRMWS